VDGASKTYLVAEKCILIPRYLTGEDGGDNESMYCGFDNDNGRSAAKPPYPDGKLKQDMHSDCFGSAHVDCWMAAFCDGSVHVMTFTIDPEMHKRLANKADRQQIVGGF